MDNQPICLQRPLRDCNYRIARNFRGLKFSRFSRINDEPRKFYPPKFYLRLTYVARDRNPRKLNREKFGQGSSAKILVFENSSYAVHKSINCSTESVQYQQFIAVMQQCVTRSDFGCIYIGI